MSVNKLTLKFTNPETEKRYSKYKVEHTHKHLPLFFGLSGAAGVYSVVRYLITGEGGSLLIFLCDCIRTSLYVSVYFIAPKLKFLRSFIGTIANLIFAIFLTEVYLMIGEPMFLVVRYLAYQSLVVLGLAEMNVNFHLSIVTLWFCKLYILTRSLTSSDEFQELLIMVIINSIIVSSILLYHVMYNKRERFLEMLKNEELHKENFKMAMSVIPDGVIQIKEGNVVFYNEITIKMFKLDDLKASTAPGKAEMLTYITSILQDINIPNSSKSLLEEAIDYEKKEKNLDEHYECLVSEGPNNPFMQIICKSINLGEPSIILLLKDLSDLKKAEKEESENKYKNLLILTVSHELRTPLNNFSSMLNLLKDYVAPGGEQYMSVIDCSYELLLALINDILDYFHISEGGISLKPSIFNPEIIMNSVVKLIKFQANQRGVDIITKTHSSTPLCIENDKNRFKQIILNGMNNAVKYTFQGQIGISMKGYNLNEVQYLQVKIKDSGIGISDQHKPHLFKMFGLVDSTASNKKSGIGLGLTLIKNISMLMGGDVEINSEEGRGTTLKFWIQSLLSNDMQEEMSLDSANIQFSTEEMLAQSIQHYNCLHTALTFRHQMHGDEETESKLYEIGCERTVTELMCNCPKILIVDDNAFNQFSLVQFLKKVNLRAEKADSGELALELINRVCEERRLCCGGYKLIFMDINMPGLNGYETARIITDMVEEKKIPSTLILACTAHDSDNHEDLCTEAGIVDTSIFLNIYIVFKPVPFDVLKEKLIFYQIISFDSHKLDLKDAIG